MKVELDKTGMVHLVLGTYPSHDMQESLIKRNLGYREKEVWYWDESWTIHSYTRCIRNLDTRTSGKIKKPWHKAKALAISLVNLL